MFVEIKTSHKLLVYSVSVVFVLGIVTTPYAVGLVSTPSIDSAEVQDNGTIIDLIIWALFPIPDPAPTPAGYGVITGLNAGNPALVITTSHAGVCDSEDQTLGTCEGLWHQHHAVLVPPTVCPPLSGTVFEVRHLSFESPGDVTPPGGTNHISFWNAWKSEAGNDAINGTFPGQPTPFQFGTADPVQAAYPVVQFDIWVNTTLGLDGLGVPVPNATGFREVCVFNVQDFQAPNVPKAVGGDLIPLDSTMVLLAGTQTTAAWMIPVVVSAIGIGIVIARKF